LSLGADISALFGTPCSTRLYARGNITDPPREIHPGDGIVVTGKRRLRRFDPTFADDESSESPSGRKVTLEHHTQGVAAQAERFICGCGLSSLAAKFVTTARWHDLGKADPRFQAMLQGRSPRTARPPLLAKSGMAYKSKHDREAARAVHRFPEGGRHEILSVAAAAAKTDDTLILHLIASHHGQARPFASPMGDETDIPDSFLLSFLGESFAIRPTALAPATANAILPERFWKMVRTYGWWGEAYLEAVFRLADHAASRSEQEQNYDPATIPVAPLPEPPSPPSLQTYYSLPFLGLDGSNPLAFLAAVGTLRLADHFYPSACMQWERRGRWIPVLHLAEEVSPEEFVEKVHQGVHRVGDQQAAARAACLHKEYRAQRKAITELTEAIKKRKLPREQQRAAYAAEIAPLQQQVDTARRDWLKALEASVPVPFLSLGKSLKVTDAEYRDFCQRVADRLCHEGPSARFESDFATAFGCEICVDPTSRLLSPTEFELIKGSGWQFFLETMEKLMAAVTPTQLHRALFNDWSYSDERLSFRWDPIDDRRYAHNWSNPSDDAVPSEHGANLLAAFALPLFPLIPTAHGRPVTTGFDPNSDPPAFTWPVWVLPSSADVVRSLIGHEVLQRPTPARQDLLTVGVHEVYRTEKIEVGSGLNIKLNLSPAVTV